MSSLLLSLLLLIYPSPSPLRSPPSPSLVFRCLRGWLCCESKAVIWGGGVQGSAEAYNLLFTPNLPPPTLTLSCILPLFHSSFCLHRGMNFNHSALHLRSRFPPSFFFFFPSLFPKSDHSLPHFFQLVSSALLSLPLPCRSGPLEEPRENKDTDIATFEDGGRREYLSLQV